MPPSPLLQSDKKYSSLLWEITGNGLKKPSYIFGTMHVSDKLAFHLGDSFYNALKNVQTVALETNPENWQDDFSKASFFGRRGNNFLLRTGITQPHDRLSLGSFAVDDYTGAVKAALSVEPSMVNGLLYRTYGTRTDDFEEDTYLDLYIFQAGKKLGKHLTGVENFEESEKIVKEAYRDMLKDRNKKRRSYDYEDRYGNPKKVEDAYRRGDLDVLDSLQAMNVSSEAFEEKFLYKRNEIQAHSIDTILKKSSLFVAVGAAHLPGKRGVIEMLRKMGYTLRPVRLDDRNSAQKEAIDNLHFPVTFNNQTSDDGFYHVSIPGKKFYRFTDWKGLDVVQNADMVNGAYYSVTRVKTASRFWGQSEDYVLRRIDSLLYENVPGKLLKKTPIVKNGYNGWEVLNRTRRGDCQRYNIFVTPFEMIVFKMSGNGDFINKGTEAQRFFGSVKLREYKPAEWVRYSPSTGGFSVRLPHPPAVLKDENYGAKRLEYSAFDKSGNTYVIMQSNLHHYGYAEEDSFELNLMNDSYAYSGFIDKELSRCFTEQNGYPALEAKYRHRDGSFSTVKYVIRGPLYYAVVAHHKKDDEAVKAFVQSFAIKPFIYPAAKLRTDTAMHFTVMSPVAGDAAKDDDDDDEMAELFRSMADEENDLTGLLGTTKSSFIGNDTIGEKIWVTYTAPSPYSFVKDTAQFWKTAFGETYYDDDDSSFVYALDKQYTLPNGTKVRDLQLTDTGSSRLIVSKWLYKNGHLFTLTALTDTVSNRSDFLKGFFNSFTPSDTLKGSAAQTRRTAQFFSDFFSADSAAAKKARKAFYDVLLDSSDATLVQAAIEKLNWNTKNYLDTKKYLIQQMGEMKESTVVPFLKNLYTKVKDTADLQNAVLHALLAQKTKEGYAAFKESILQEPPLSGDEYISGDYVVSFRRQLRLLKAPRRTTVSPEYSGSWSELYDSLALTKTLFPDLLQLMDVDDYKIDVMDLLTKLVDSGHVKAPAYEAHFSKLYLDGKQLLKKQIAGEEKEAIEKRARKDRPRAYYYYDNDEGDNESDAGNEALDQYAVLLLPFWEKNPGVPAFFAQLLKAKDRKLVYNTFILLLRNNKPVPDSLFTKFAKADEYRSDLYKALKDAKKLDRFPAAYKTQEQIARSLLQNNGSYYGKPDTLVPLTRLPVTYKTKQGWVYFYKYREERDDSYWKLASVGMQPMNADSIDAENDDFTEVNGRRLDAAKPLQEQLQKMLKELLNAKRSSASDFYNSRRYNLYKTYLPEMVKSRRYRD